MDMLCLSIMLSKGNPMSLGFDIMWCTFISCLQTAANMNKFNFCYIPMSMFIIHIRSSLCTSGVHKHAVVHRDINSRNILVRGDMTCAIADMGFSMKIRGSKIIKQGVEEHAADGSLRDVSCWCDALGGRGSRDSVHAMMHTGLGCSSLMKILATKALW